MKRDVSIDVFRMFLMCGIIMLHLTAFVDFWRDWKHLAYVLSSCVDGFVLITGYFGTRFSWRKICKLYATAIYCILFVTTVGYLLGSCEDIPHVALNVFKEFWFLHSYAFLICCVPLVNHVFETCSARRCFSILLPTMIVVLCGDVL